ncbi:MAG: protein kinase, partial [Deltaproteobacteria bacterium]|nr:protein kinase [Deltaproteobacteria bacterium]
APSGTPAYMAPEQVRGGDITPATDVFALGTMLYELFAGLLPWDAKSGYELALARVIHPPRPISALAAHLPAHLASIVMRCIEREPSARFASARALRDALSHATGEHAVTELASLAIAPPPAPRIARLPRLAVLPFQGRGGDDAELESGLAEDLALALASQRGLHVLSQRAITPLLGRDLDAIDLCRELDATYLVEGSVRRTGTNFRIGVRLLSREAGDTIWTGRFDRAPGALLEVGDEAAAAILGALGLSSKPQAPMPSRDPRAIELYLRARPAIRSLRVERLDQAVGWLEEARALSPNDPSIDASLALALCRRWMMQMAPAAEDLARAGSLADAAIARGTDHGEAHFARALVQLNCGEPIVAARALRRAIAHAPSLGEAHEQLGILLLEAGHIAGAQQRLQVAAALDPTLLAPAWSGALQLAYAGDWAAHDAAFAVAGVGDGDAGLRWWWRARMALWRNDADHAAALYAELVQATDIAEHPVVTWAKATLDALRLRNPADNSLAILDAWSAGPQAGARRAMGLGTLRAEVMAYSGDLVGALGAVASAVEFGLFDTPWLSRCPLLAPLRTNPEWGPLAAKVEARAAEVLDALRGDGSEPGK